MTDKDRKFNSQKQVDDATEKINKDLVSLNEKQKNGGLTFELTEAEAKHLDILERELSKFRLSKNHYIILCIEKLLEIANANKWDLCKNEAFIFLYNGFYWNEISKE
jgi:putative DNA primase/helicase